MENEYNIETDKPKECAYCWIAIFRILLINYDTCVDNYCLCFIGIKYINKNVKYVSAPSFKKYIYNDVETKY